MRKTTGELYRHSGSRCLGNKALYSGMLHLVYTMYLFIIYNCKFQTIYTESFQWQFFLWDICGIFLHYSLDGKKFFLTAWDNFYPWMVADLSYPCMERDFPYTWMAIKFQNVGYQRSKFLLRGVHDTEESKLSNLRKSSWKRNCTRKCCSTFIRGQDGLVWREKVGETFRGLVP